MCAWIGAVFGFAEGCLGVGSVIGGRSWYLLEVSKGAFGVG